MGNLAAVLSEQGKGDEATSIQERTTALMEKAFESNPTKPEFREYLSAQYQNLAIYYLKNGKPERAQKLADEFIKLGESLVKDYPDRPGYRHGLAMSYHDLGAAAWRCGGHARLKQRIARPRRSRGGSWRPRCPTYQVIITCLSMSPGSWVTS